MSNDRNGGSRTDILDRIVTEENLPKLISTIETAISQYESNDSDLDAARSFVEALMTEGFWVNYRTGSSNTDFKKGTIKWFNINKGYGFIVPDDSSSSDVYVSEKLLKNAGILVEKNGKQIIGIREGDKCLFIPTTLQNGRLSARYIKIVNS